MSEYELVDAFVSFQGLLQGWITAYFAGVTAYLVAGIAVSLKFMWDVRHPRQQQQAGASSETRAS